MFDKTPIETLECIKTALYFSGAAVTMSFGIYAAIKETHSDQLENINGKNITKRKANKFLYITIIGIIVGTFITASSYWVDQKIETKKVIAENAAKEKFRESVALGFQESLTRLENLNSSASKLVKDLG